MTLPPEDPPPGKRGPKLFDANEHIVTTPPPAFPDEPITAVEGIKSLPPLKDGTRTPAPMREHFNAEAIRHEAERLGKLLPEVATKAELAELRLTMDGGFRMVLAELRGLRDDMTKALGQQSAKLDAIIDKLGFVTEQTNSALGAISSLTPRLSGIEERQKRTQRVANGTWVQVTTGKVDERECAAINDIVVSDSAAR